MRNPASSCCGVMMLVRLLVCVVMFCVRVINAWQQTPDSYT